MGEEGQWLSQQHPLQSAMGSDKTSSERKMSLGVSGRSVCDFDQHLMRSG